MKETLSVAFWMVVLVLVADVFGFFLWGVSGQMPADNFYLGSITTNTIQWLMYR